MKQIKIFSALFLCLFFLTACSHPSAAAACDLDTDDVREMLYVGMAHSELFTAMGYPTEYDLLADIDVSYVIEDNRHYRWALTDGNTLDILMENDTDALDGTHISEIKVSSPSGKEIYKQLCRPLDLENLPNDFDLFQAKNSGLTVHENGHVTSGEDTFSYFLSKTEKGEPCTIYIGNYYTLLDSSHYDPAYYESIKDNYPVLYISELTFDGKHYVHTQYDNGKKIAETYAYLVPSYKPADPMKPNETEGSTRVYMLSDDPNGSFNDWMRAISSSSVFGDFKRTWPIYTE